MYNSGCTQERAYLNTGTIWTTFDKMLIFKNKSDGSQVLEIAIHKSYCYFRTVFLQLVLRLVDVFYYECCSVIVHSAENLRKYLREAVRMKGHF